MNKQDICVSVCLCVSVCVCVCLCVGGGDVKAIFCLLRGICLLFCNLRRGTVWGGACSALTVLRESHRIGSLAGNGALTFQKLHRLPRKNRILLVFIPLLSAEICTLHFGGRPAWRALPLMKGIVEISENRVQFTAINTKNTAIDTKKCFCQKKCIFFFWNFSFSHAHSVA